MGNIINFDDIVSENNNNTESIFSNEYDIYSLTENEAKLIEEYFEDSSFKNRKFIDMFNNHFDGSIRSMIHTLVDLDIYVSEHQQSFEGRAGSEYITDECLNYADFYEYFACNFLNNDIVVNHLYYHFNDAIPRILDIGESISCEYLKLINAYYFEKLKENNVDIYNAFNKIIASIKDVADFNIAHFFVVDADGVGKSGDSIPISTDAPDVVQSRCDMLIKANIMEISEKSGYLILLKSNDGNMSVSSLKIDDGSIYIIDPEATKELIKECAKTSMDFLNIISQIDFIQYERFNIDFS